MKIRVLLIIASVVLMPSIVKADLDDVADRMCTKIKQCSLESAGADAMPPEVQEMMKGMFDGLCKSMMQPYYDSAEQAGLANEAEACTETVVATSCEELLSSDGQYSTPECEEFKAAADEAGVDIGQ